MFRISSDTIGEEPSKITHPTPLTSPKVDLFIYGGTPGGLACAIRAARLGLSVVVVNVTDHIGGMLSAGLGLFDTSFQGNRSPLTQEFFAAILRHYETTDGRDSENYRLCREYQTFEPHVAEATFERLVAAEPNITLHRSCHIRQVERSGRRILAAVVEGFQSGNLLRIEADTFVDASYEGDFFAAAGASYRIGRESRQEFGEPHAGRIFTRYEEQSEKSKKFPFEAAQGLIDLIPFDLCTGRIFPGSTGEGDTAIMAYNFRIFLSRDPDNQAPIPKPDGYRREPYLGLLMDEMASLGTPYPVKSKWLQDPIEDFQFRNHRTMPNRKLSWNHGSFPARNHRYPEADREEREAILKAHRDHELGLLWFLQNDPEVPKVVRERARAWGLAKDEFTDNGHFPWEIYVREARRLRGRAVFTELDASLAPGLARTPPHADAIAITDWMMDSHECNTVRQPGSAYEGTVLLSEATRPGQVPYRCLLPEDVDNLLVPVCLSATHIGWGTIRVEPTWMHIAESAAHAVYLAKNSGTSVADIDVGALQLRLIRCGIMITFFNWADMGCGQPWLEAVQFLGTRGFFAGYTIEPDLRLGKDTARIWLEAYRDLLRGTQVPLVTAQAIAAAANEGLGPTPKKFILSLTEITRECLGRSLPEADLLQPAAESADVLDRGTAIRIIFAAWQLCLLPLQASTVVYTEYFHTTGGQVAIDTVNWQTFNTAGATDKSNNSAFAEGFVISHLNGKDGQAGYPVTTFKGIGLTFTNEFTSIVRSVTEIATLRFATNNANTTDSYRFAIQIDVEGTPTWYATSSTYTQGTAGEASNFPTVGEFHTFNFTTAGSAWRELGFTPGSTLSLGAQLSDPLPMGDLLAAGIYNDLNTSTLRWDQFEIAVIPEPGQIAGIRNSQATAVELTPGGRILLAFARYGGGGTDHSANGIYQIHSDDGGITWSEPVRMPTGQPQQNLGAASLVPLEDRLLFGFWFRNGWNDSVLKMMESEDGGVSWSEPRQVVPNPETPKGIWLTGLNDGILRLKSGRLVWALQTLTGVPRPEDDLGVLIAYSDDSGATWQRSPATSNAAATTAGEFTYLPVIRQPQSDPDSPLRLHEPSIIQRKDESLWMLARTTRGRLFTSESQDGGETWTPLRPSEIRSETAPPYLKRLSDGRMILLSNPVANEDREQLCLPPRKRPILQLQFSSDDGHTWRQPIQVANDSGKHGFCYPNVVERIGAKELLIFFTRTPDIIYPGALVMVRLPLEAPERHSVRFP